MRRLIWICLFLPILAVASAKPQFVAGKDYEVLTVTPPPSSIVKDKVTVTEFFNYGCPWCFRLEATLEDWIANKPAYVNFRRIPVAFNESWEVYAKAYYVAEALGVEEKMTLPLFKAIHDQGRNLSSFSAMQDFFADNGVTKQQFDAAFNSSPTIDAQVEQGRKLVNYYGIYGIPAIIVAGKYKTDSKMNEGDAKHMVSVLKFLIEKAHAESAAKK